MRSRHIGWIGALTLLGALAGGAQNAPPAKLKLLKFSLPADVKPQTAALPMSVPRYDLPANRIIFPQRDVRLVVECDFDFVDRVFRINGLINPDIQVVRGARVAITVLELSRQSKAMFLVLATPPPYSDPPAPLGLWGVFHPIPMDGGVMDNGVPPRVGDNYHDVVVTYQAETVGVAYYASGFAGEAGDGEYGRRWVSP